MATEVMVQPDEISQILKQQLLGFEKEIDIYETGTVLYVGCGVGKVGMESLVKSLLPFYFTLVALLVVFLLFPGVVLWFR